MIRVSRVLLMSLIDGAGTVHVCDPAGGRLLVIED
jgi:hypothetical protein